MMLTYQRGRNPLFIVIIILSIVFISAETLVAKEKSLTITEIMYNPDGKDDKREWVEAVALDEMVFKTEGKNQTLPFRTCDRFDEAGKKCEASHPVYFNGSELKLDRDDVFIIANNTGEFMNQFPDYSEILLESKINLANGDKNFFGIYEQDSEAKDIWHDMAWYEKKWGGDGNGKTLEKIDSKGGAGKENWTQSFYMGGTPGKEYETVDVDFSEKIYINEVMLNPVGKDEDGEWIELYNAENEKVDLTGWSIADDSGKNYFFNGDEIEKNGYFVLHRKQSKISLNNTGEKITLANPLGDQAHKVDCEKANDEGRAWARKKDGLFGWTDTPTPGEKNKFPVPKNYVSDIFFNEILPNPQGTDKNNEWIELFNGSEEIVDMDGWTIENKSGKIFIIVKTTIKPGGLGLIEIKNSSFSIKNSNEVLRLFDPNKEAVCGVSFLESAKSGVSYNLGTDNQWKWSRFLTPGAENKLNNPPIISIDFDKKVYKNVKAHFDASKTRDPDRDDLKFHWDFGDGHGSYLGKTSHIFEDNGRYKISLTVNDGSEKSTKVFEVEVEGFPRKDLEIVGLMPNPKGKDSESEFVQVRNNSKKKANLGGYYLATGKEENSLVNHPINDDVKIEPGRTEKIEREACKIVLPNKEGVVELRYPDKKTADQVSYAKDKIKENEKYVLVEGGWIWIADEQSSVFTPNEGATRTSAIIKKIAQPRLPINISYIELAKNEENSICECLLAMRTENWKSKNRVWLGLIAQNLASENFFRKEVYTAL